MSEAPCDRDGALVYLSLGSLGSADVDLMRRLVAVLADTDLRARMAADGERIRAADGTRVAADLIEQVGRAARD